MTDHVFFNLQNLNNTVGTKNVNIISIDIMAKLDNEKEYKNLKTDLIQLIRDINSNAEKKIINVYKEEFLINQTLIEKSKKFFNKELIYQTQLEASNQNYEKLKILLDKINLDNQKQNEIEKTIMLLN